ncbi:MAG: FG-GAP repeat domain-containing protein [Pirellulales bacterium]
MSRRSILPTRGRRRHSAIINTHSPRLLALETLTRTYSVSYSLKLEPLERRILLAADFGDAPAFYPTLLAENGAHHEAVGPTLGAARDSEADGAHSAAADADGADDDGLTLGTMQVGQLGATVIVNVQGGAAKLDAWIDFNGDGNWGGPGEQIADSLPMAVGDNVLAFDVPSSAASGVTFARFRLSTAGDLGLGGAAADGEVEDYALTIDPPPLSSGNFGPAQPIDSGVPNGVANTLFAADIDGDGDNDLVKGSLAAISVSWYENDGQGTFTPHTLPGNDDFVYSIIAVDLDGDTDCDFVYQSLSQCRVVWLENDGEQNFTRHTLYADEQFIAAFDAAVSAVDMEGDGDLDLVTFFGESSHLQWLENDGQQNFVPHVIATVSNANSEIAPADIDGDGDLDVVGGPWYENNGAQAFMTRFSAAGSLTAVTADLDGDGLMDIAGGDGGLTWFRNLGFKSPNGVQQFTAFPGSDPNSRDMTGGDIDGDDDIDLVASSSADDVALSWYVNKGSQTFTRRTLAGPKGLGDVVLADLDGDGDLDAVLGSDSETLNWYENLATVPSAVASRQLFYNQSAFDGDNVAINAADDGAIALDKSAYLPGDGVATFANVSSYARGINGIMLDLTPGTAVHAAITRNDFAFKVGNNNSPDSWTLAPTPTAVSVRTGAGTSGSDRVEITWASGAIKNAWLEVQVLANDNTGLEAPDVFYFGSRVGDTGAPSEHFFTTTVGNDVARISAGTGSASSITDVRDIDRSNTITLADDRAAALANIGVLNRLNVGGVVFADSPATDADLPDIAPGPVHYDRGVASALAQASSPGETVTAGPTVIIRGTEPAPKPPAAAVSLAQAAETMDAKARKPAVRAHLAEVDDLDEELVALLAAALAGG